MWNFFFEKEYYDVVIWANLVSCFLPHTFTHLVYIHFVQVHFMCVQLTRTKYLRNTHAWNALRVSTCTCKCTNVHYTKCIACHVWEEGIESSFSICNIYWDYVPIISRTQNEDSKVKIGTQINNEYGMVLNMWLIRYYDKKKSA